MLSKYFHCFSFDGGAMLSWSLRYLFVNVLGSSIHSPTSSPLLDTFDPSTNIVLLLTSSLTVFIVMDVFCPFTPRSRSSFSKMNVTWLQLSSNACVFTVFPERLYLRFNGNAYHISTSVAYFLSTPSALLFWHNRTSPVNKLMTRASKVTSRRHLLI